MKKAYSIDGWPIVSMPTIIAWSPVKFFDGVQLSYEPEPDGSTEIAWENQRQMLVDDVPICYRPERWEGASPAEALWLDLMDNAWPDSALQWAENDETLQRMIGYDREESIDTRNRPWGWWRTA